MVLKTHPPAPAMPPLKEVVQNIVFDELKILKDWDLGKVRALFADDFPIVQEQIPFGVTFEMFGGDAQSGMIVPRVASPQQITGKRLWFISKDQHLIVQFQRNMMAFNWRDLGKANSYPGYEKLFETFSGVVNKLNNFIKNEGEKLTVRQCELAYVNQIVRTDDKPLQEYFTFCSSTPEVTEAVNLTLSELYPVESDQPYGRFCPTLKALNLKSPKSTIGLTLSLRQLVPSANLEDALKTFWPAHDYISQRFNSLVTTQVSQEAK